MKERLTKRRETRSKQKSGKVQADELYCYDESGVKIPGKYDASGSFIVAASYRAQVKVDSNGFMLAANGKPMINSKIKDRIKKREMQSRQGATSPSKNGRDARKKRSGSRGSLEEDVDPAKMYEYFQEQSASISKKAEGDRAQLKKTLEINKQMRQYDLKNIKTQELEDMKLGVQKLKDNWSDLRAFLQHKVQTLSDVKERHDTEVKEYK